MESIKNGYADLGITSFKTFFSEENTLEFTGYILNGIVENNKKFNLNHIEIKSNIFTSESLKIRLNPIAKSIDIP